MESKILDTYHIEGTINLDKHPCFNNPNTFPQFQEGLNHFKYNIKQLVDEKKSKTFYKFGDGDYRFLRRDEIGSAKPGNRAISKAYDEINHQEFIDGASKCDYYTCEIYPENRTMCHNVINKKISYPAEYGYGLVANKWFFQNFKGRIGLLGASEKIYLIEELMQYQQYQDYLGLDSFTDYIHFPQKYAADDINLVEKFVGEQLKKSSSDIFLLGIGHAKSAVLHRFTDYKKSVFLDVGAGIDMLAGCINTHRPYAGDWKNFRLSNHDYSEIDYLKYNATNEVLL